MTGFKFDTSDFDRKMGELTKKAHELEKGENVRLVDLLSDDFIRRHSKFQSFQAMADAGGIKNPEEINSEQFSQFVSAQTKFGGYQEMVQQATSEYIKSKLGL